MSVFVPLEFYFQLLDLFLLCSNLLAKPVVLGTECYTGRRNG